MIIAVALLPVIAPALWAHTRFDTGATIALLGVCGVLAALFPLRRPPATVPRRSSAAGRHA